MALRQNPYEAAFEAYLRSLQIPYVATDEARRSLAAGESLKTLDFIVSPPGQRGLLVDVKGRRFPTARRKQYWKNWATSDDLRGLSQWQKLFGEHFQALLVFAYLVCEDQAPLPPPQMFRFRDQYYGFVGIEHQVYARAARLISPRWQTYALSGQTFCQLARPITRWLGTNPPEEPGSLQPQDQDGSPREISWDSAESSQPLKAPNS